MVGPLECLEDSSSSSDEDFDKEDDALQCLFSFVLLSQGREAENEPVNEYVDRVIPGFGSFTFKEHFR